MNVSASRAHADLFVRRVLVRSSGSHQISWLKVIAERVMTEVLRRRAAVWISQVDLLEALQAAGFRCVPDGTHGDHLVFAKSRAPGGTIDRGLRLGVYPPPLLSRKRAAR